jgi:hypothetical protein
MRLFCYLCVCVSFPNVARQRFGKHLPAATNTPATIEELIDSVFSLRSVSYKIPNMQ